MGAAVKEGVAIMTSGDVVMTVWTVPVTPALWVWHVKALERVIAESPNGIISIGLVHGPHKLPSATVVGLMQDDYRRIRGDVRRLALATLGDSFWATLTRALLRTMATVVGSTQLLELADTIDDALQLAVDVASDRTPSLGDLYQMVDELHHALGVNHDRTAPPPPL